MDAPFPSLPTGLPNGHLVQPDPDFSRTTTTPVMWMTDDYVDDPAGLWAWLFNHRAALGLYPLVLTDAPGLEGRPWGDGELEPIDPATADKIDVDEWLKDRWTDITSGVNSWVDTGVDEWLGPLPVQPARRALDDLTPITDYLREDVPQARIGLVPATTGSQALGVLGWLGPMNHFGTDELVAVIRSWERRFGFCLVEVGFASITGSAAATPVENVLALTQEHYVACPDVIDQVFGGSVADYVAGVKSDPIWYFWWD